MKDAWTAADLNILKTRPQRSVWYLAVHRPASVYSASIAVPSTTFPASAINVTNIGGVAGDVQAGMTLRIGANASGSSKGIIRVRENMSGSVIQIAEAGSGLINFKQNDIVTVMNQFLPWTKHPKQDTATSQWAVDHIAYTNQLSLYGPHVNIGPPAAVFLDGGTATVPYISSRSFSASVVSDTFDTYAWVFPDGVTNAGRGTEDASIDMVYLSASPGGSYVSLTITDSNSVSAVGRRLAWAFDDRTQPHRVEFADITGGIRKGGYKANLRVSTTATSDDFPDMAEIIIFEEASYGGTASTIGGNYPWRSNIVFRGWIDGKTVNINPFSGDVMFSAVTIDGIMNKLESHDLFLGDMSTDASAHDWIGASGLTTERTAWQLLTHRSTIGTLVDFSSAGGYASKINAMLYQEFPRSPLWKQISRMYREYGTYGYAAADMQSNIYGMNDVQITGGSAALPLNEITKQDRRDIITVKEKNIDENVEAHFLSIASDTPIWVRTPGDVMGYYGKKKEHARGLYADQQTLTQWVGNWAAKLNSNLPSITIPLAGNYRYDSVPQSRISLSMSATDNVRGYSWNDKEFLPFQTKVHYNNEAGTVLTEIEVEEIVDGVGGSAVTLPRIEHTPPPETEDRPVPDEIPPPTMGGGMGTVYVMTTTKLWKTTDFSVSSPAWTDIAPNENLNDFILDPWNPSTTGYLLDTAGLQKSTDLNVASPAFSYVLTAATLESFWGGNFESAFKIVASINFDGYVGFQYIIVVDGNTTRACYSYSSDGGVTWNHKTVFYFTGGTSRDLYCFGALDYVPHNINGQVVLYCALGLNDVGGGNKSRLYKSTNSGNTWTLMFDDTASTKKPMFVHCPHNGNEGGNIVYWGTGIDVDETWKSTDSGVSRTQLEPSAGDHVQTKRTGLESHTEDNQQLYFWEADDETLYVSSNGGTDWTTKNKTGLNANIICAAGGFPDNSAQFYVVSANGVFISTDTGNTFTDKTGNMDVTSGSITGLDTGIDNRVSRAVVVPNWLE